MWSSKNKVFEKILSVTKEAATEQYHKYSTNIILVKMITHKYFCSAKIKIAWLFILEFPDMFQDESELGFLALSHTAPQLPEKYMGSGPNV